MRLPVDEAFVELVEMTAHHVPGPPEAPDVKVLVYRPKAAKGDLPCIFHTHGGGYIGGAAADLEGLHRPMAAMQKQKTRCILVGPPFLEAQRVTALFKF